MTLIQALIYFAREALINLLRSWKISLVAVLTIAVSLFLGGVFLLIASNLAVLVEDWRAESRIIVYLASESDAESRAEARRQIADASWVQRVEEVDADQARDRFVVAFPSLEDLLDGWGEEPLPPSLEIVVDVGQIETPAFVAWLERLRAEPAVAMVDDDRDWLAQLETAIFVLRGLGMAIGGVLLATAMFTIASVIRLTAYLYRDEIAVMRMVGATEFFIRGPFYVEGLLQGLAGGLLAVSALAAAHAALVPRADPLFVTALTREFLGPVALAALVVLGGLAGLGGAVASLRREALRPRGEDG